MVSETRPRRGRPPAGEKAKKDVIAVRATDAFRARIDEAAARSGRSMSQEIEARIEQSFWADRMFHNPETLKVFSLLTSAIQMSEGREMREPGDRPESWLKDAATGAAAVAACKRILDAFTPGLGDTEEEKKAAEWGRGLAGMMVDNHEKAKADRHGKGDEQA